jgi:hypothetical protein
LFGTTTAINIKSEEQLSKTVHKKKELLEIDLSQSKYENQSGYDQETLSP